MARGRDPYGCPAPFVIVVGPRARSVRASLLPRSSVARRRHTFGPSAWSAVTRGPAARNVRGRRTAVHLAQLRTASGIHCSDEARVPHTRRMSRLKRLRKYLRRAQRRHDCLHIVRRIKKADQIDGYVVGVGKSWVCCRWRTVAHQQGSLRSVCATFGGSAQIRVGDRLTAASRAGGSPCQAWRRRNRGS